MKKAAVLSVLLALVLSVINGAFGNNSQPEPLKNRRILILIGPQYGLPIVDQILPPLKHDLKEGGIILDNIFVEFLDLHRNTDPRYRADILALLEHKLNEREPGLIIAINQGAVDFVAREAKDLFPGVPMLIPILEKYPEWEGEPRVLITLTTRQDAEGTLGYALELFPETKRAVIIMGKDDHGAPFVEPVRAALEAVRNGQAVETTADLTYEEMLEMITKLPPNTIAFYGSYFHDITGRSFVPAEVAAKVGATANVPVFAFRDMHIVSGLAGGSIAITADMGRLAAQISLEYLDGKLVLEEPVTNFDVPNFPLFDWMQLKQMGGNVSTLPENTIFLNRPLTIWEQYSEIVIIIAISFVLLVILSIALAFRTRQQKKLIVKLNEAKITLRESESLLARSQKIAHVGSWKLNLVTNKLYWSDEVYRIFGIEPQKFTATYEAFFDYVHPGDRVAVDEAYSHSLREGTDSYEIEHRIVRKGTGEVRHVFERCVHERDDTGAIIQSIGMVQDITERKLAEEFIRESAERARLQRNLIAELTFDDTVVNGSIDDALKIVTTKLAKTLKVDRVSVWLLSEDEKKLLRQTLYDAATGFDSLIDVLNTADTPSYFEALRKDSQIDADDAQNDPRTKELTDHYFIPLHISSLLDSAIQQDGRLIGVISVEYRGPVRKWHDDEKSFLSAITNLVAQLFANAERRKTEEAIRQSENRFNCALENIPDVVVIYDNDLKIQFINAATTRITGRPISDFIGKREDEIWPPEVYQVYLPMLQESLNTGKVQYLDTDLRFPNGDIRSLGITCVPLIDKKGAVREVMGVTHDYTERKQAEEKLKLLNRAVEASSVSVVITDVEGTISYVNPYLLKNTGYSYEEVIGNNPRVLNSGKQPKSFYEDLWQTIKSGKDWSGNFQNMKKSGELFWEKAVISPILNRENGEITNFVAIKEDITERKKILEELAATLKDKENLIQELAHRIYNNMQVIEALLEYKLLTEPDLSMEQYVNDITGHIRSMALVHRELNKDDNLSRIDLGEYLKSLALSIVEHNQKNVNIKLTFDLVSVQVLLDSAVPLGTIINELLSNAVKHAFPDDINREHPAEIRISSRVSESDKIEVCIHDNGINWAISDELNTFLGGGNDLAIALVKEQLGGTISFDGNNGTTIRIAFKDNRYSERV